MKVSLARFSEAVALIHQAGTAPEQWPQALAALMALVNGERASLMDIDASNNLLGMSQVGHDSAVAKLYADHYFSVDPTQRLSLVVPALHSITVFEEFPKLVRARHEYFDFAERVCKIGDVLGVSTGVAEGRRAILGVQRAVDAVGYGAQEKTLIELVVQHIDLAKRVQIKLGEALLAKSELEAAFSHLTAAAFIVDAQRRVCHLNAAAECLLARHRQCITRNSKLAFSDARMDAAFAGAVKEAACELGRSAALPLTLGGATTEVLVAPLQPAHRLASPWQRPLALVAIPCDPDEKYIAWRMQQLYRLTPTESRVAAALAMGKTIERIALENAVTEATLRTQLKSIFSKTNTSRQAELVRLALAGITFR